MFPSKRHVVKEGDTLSQLAVTYRLPSWEMIYNAPENTEFRRIRKSPHKIYPGDLLLIPPNPIIVLEYQKNQLLKLREESISMFNDLLNEINKEYKTAKKWGKAVDTIAILFSSVKSITKSAKKCLDILSKRGAEFYKAKDALLRSAYKDSAISLAGIVNENQTITGEENLASATMKILLKSWFDMTTPSYWTHRIIGFDIDEVHHNTINQILYEKSQSLRTLDAKIQEIDDNILKIKARNKDIAP